MSDEFPFQDPQDIWQNQSSESLKMSTEIIKRKAQDFESSSRESAFAWIVLGLLIAAINVWQFLRVNDTLQRSGYALLCLWGIYGGYQAYRWLWPRRSARETATGASLSFYRRELERRLEYDRYIWWRTGLPICFLGLGLIILPSILKAPKLAANTIPFLVLLTVWFFLFIPKRRRQRRKLQADIEELDALERDSR